MATIKVFQEGKGTPKEFKKETYKEILTPKKPQVQVKPQVKPQPTQTVQPVQPNKTVTQKVVDTVKAPVEATKKVVENYTKDIEA